jgi:hypothetical protein
VTSPLAFAAARCLEDNNNSAAHISNDAVLITVQLEKFVLSAAASPCLVGKEETNSC